MESLVNAVSNVRKRKLPPRRDRRLAGDEEQRLLEVAGCPMRELIVLALETGMRQSELMALTSPGVDLKRRIVTLAETKTGDGRAVPLSKRAVETIESLPGQRQLELTGDDNYFFRFIGSRSGVD